MSTGRLYELMFRFIIIGDCFVGKTALTHRFISDQYMNHYEATIGVDFGANIVKLSNGVNVKCQIWDTAGQENFAPLIKSYYKDIAGAIIVFDVANRSSFTHLKFWLKEFENNNNANYPISKILIGNKIDICNRVISYEEAEAFATEHNLSYQETSVKNNINVQNVFMTLCEDIYKNKDLNKGIVVNNESHLSLSSNKEGKNRSYYDCCLIS